MSTRKQAIHHEVEQGSHEWQQLRIGRITASRVRDIAKTKRGGVFAYKMAQEVITQMSSESDYISPEMQRGIDLESEAVAMYEEMKGLTTCRVGFFTSAEYPFLGLSPDRIVNSMEPGKRKALEVKCPDSHTHIRYIYEGRVPDEYLPQLLHYFIVIPNLDSVDFVSYDDRVAIRPLFCVTLNRADYEKEIAAQRAMVLKFWDEVQDIVQKVTF